jgi:hypothetical protein
MNVTLRLAVAAALGAATLAACATPTASPASDGFTYPDQMFAPKTSFANQQDAALAQPFTGLRTKDGKQFGLFPIRATGVSTEPMRLAADALLATLTTPQKLRTQFGIGDSEWRRWFNVDNGIYARQGISLKEMTPDQRSAAFSLMRASLSARGFELTEAIRKTDQTLKEINDGAAWLDEELYYFTIMGEPSATKPWGWQLDGHHLVINYFVLGDQVVMTPTFLGAEPAIATTGKYAGNSVLQEEQDRGLALMTALDAGQRAFATLDARKPGDNMKAGANQDNLVLDYAGVPANTFSQKQKDDLLALIAFYVGNMDEGHAKVRMDEVAAHIDNTWFAWVGPVSPDAVFYYRIHSPVILIEFDHQRPVGTRAIGGSAAPTRDHIHIIIRTPNGNDYGKDLLGQHLADHSH